MEPREQEDQNEPRGSDSPREQDQPGQSDSPRGHDEPHGSDSPSRGGYSPEESRPEAPQVIETNAPLIASGPARVADWAGNPDGTMVVQTTRIREPNTAYTPSFVMVPVETENPRRDRSGEGQGHEKGKAGEQAKNEKNAGSGKEKGTKSGQDSQHGQHDDGHGSNGHARNQKGRQSQSPSMMRILLLAGAVSLVCGVGGAFAYSHFFGSDRDRSGGQKSSGQDSGSGGGSDSGGSSGSSGSSESGSDAGSGGKDSSPGGKKPDTSKGGSAKKSSSSSQNAASMSKLLEAQEAWLTAVKELRRLQSAEEATRHEADQQKAILNFLKTTVLAAGHAGDASLSELFWNGGEGKDITLTRALDSAESQVADAFADRPLAEAAVREVLGLGYLHVGQAKRAVQQYERALALREATQGPNQPETAECRNELAVAYRLDGRTTEAARLFDRNPNTPAHAKALAVRGSMLLIQKKPAEAELRFRECLEIRRKIQPDNWTTYETESMLGEALLDQRKFSEAEPLSLSGYQGMKQREDAIPGADRPRITQALERLVRLYEAWGKSDEASRWRKEMDRTVISRSP